LEFVLFLETWNTYLSFRAKSKSTEEGLSTENSENVGRGNLSRDKNKTESDTLQRDIERDDERIVGVFCRVRKGDERRGRQVAGGHP